MGKRSLNREQMAAVVRLTNALYDETSGAYGKPAIMDGWDTVTICWDGPSEWTMILGGSSVYAGESCSYSTPTETKIADALKAVEASGIFLEPINSCQVGCYDI